jgi:hypothetical protein
MEAFAAPAPLHRLAINSELVCPPFKDSFDPSTIPFSPSATEKSSAVQVDDDFFPSQLFL